MEKWDTIDSCCPALQNGKGVGARLLVLWQPLLQQAGGVQLRIQGGDALQSARSGLDVGQAASVDVARMARLQAQAPGGGRAAVYPRVS